MSRCHQGQKQEKRKREMDDEALRC